MKRFIDSFQHALKVHFLPRRMRFWVCFLLFLVCSLSIFAEQKISPHYFGIQVVDEQTGRGIPLIELRTVNDISYYSDSGGWIAFFEPGLMNREVFFTIGGPGYEFPKDGFGFRGIPLMTTPGTTKTLKLKRINIAERLYRITGQGIYRDRVLLGLSNEKENPNLHAGVLGQDSVQVVPYQGKLFWLWGDTNLTNYPLGNFHTTSARSPLPGTKGFSIDRGVSLEYFTDLKQPDRVREMVPEKAPGPVWLFGLLTIKEGKDKEKLISHFSRHKSLAEVVEHGLVEFDDEQGIFKKIETFDLKNTWQHPRGNAFLIKECDKDYFYFASPFAYTRVPANLESIRDPNQYESFVFDAKSGNYQWQKELPPTTQEDERKLLKSKKISSDQTRYQIADIQTGKIIKIHGGSIAWNAYRKKWILIALQYGDKDSPSLLGELWYSEAESPTGPWQKGIKIVSHPKYSFYNPRHHLFFDEEGGRKIYFEGTYTYTFSGNTVPTPRYDYNQIMYRLDLGDERIRSLSEAKKE
jgi:hypothetical protein